MRSSIFLHPKHHPTALRSVSYLFRQEHSFIIYGLFWPNWRENVVASSISHFSRATMWLWRLKTAHTTKHCTTKFGNAASPSILKYESLTPNLRFISVMFVRITLTQLSKWVFSGKIYIVRNKSIIHVLFLYILEFSLQACKIFRNIKRLLSVVGFSY